jgi:methylated-DNA-[protein]-cysteine S-methyltransferase
MAPARLQVFCFEGPQTSFPFFAAEQQLLEPRRQMPVRMAPSVSSLTVRLAADTLATPVGELFIVCGGDALCVVDFDGCEDRVQAALRRRFGAYELVRVPNPLGVTDLLERYFAGDVTAVDGVRVNPGGTPYQQRVWDELRRIPAGSTRTYAQVAADVGGTHARAVGGANALNPIAIVVPCHRVVGADATLTGYAGGLARKRWLLDHESRQGLLPF